MVNEPINGKGSNQPIYCTIGFNVLFLKIITVPIYSVCNRMSDSQLPIVYTISITLSNMM